MDGQLGYIVNPVLVAEHEERTGPEGCLSIPGITGHLRGELFIDRLDGHERVQVMRKLRSAASGVH